MDYKDKALDQIEEILQWSMVDLADIPKIPLYMEQVTSFFDEIMARLRRTEDDKILTKTMINNYTKEGTLPRPVGKKYSREHMIRLVYIFMLKQMLSLQDIKQIFELLGRDNDTEAVYSACLSIVEEYKDSYRQSLATKMEHVEEKLIEKGINTEENFELLLVMLTATEAMVGKMLIWKMLDGAAEQRQQEREAAREQVAKEKR